MSIIFTNKGVSATNAQDTLAEVQSDWTAALGSTLNLDPETPQGQLMASQAAIIIDKDNQFLRFINQINPKTADGMMQDAIAAIYFLDRIPARSSTVTVQCRGLAGTYIPGKNDANTAIIKSTNNDLFACENGGFIPSGGIVDLQFTSLDTGAIPVGTNTLTTIYKVVPGWDSCDNAAPGVVGRDTETRSELESRRAKSIAKNAIGTVDAVRANILALPGVIDCLVSENKSDLDKYIGTVLLIPHSVYITVAGGNDQDIAKTIYDKLNPGCAMNGNTTVLYNNINIIFQRAISVPFKIEVTILKDTAPAGIESKIKQSIYDNFNGIDGSPRAAIGSTIYTNRFYCNLNELAVNTINIKIAGASGIFANFASVGIDEIPTLTLNDITVILQ